MQKGKTHFEQVPIEVAENALRLQATRRTAIANRSLLSRHPVRIRVGPRRFLRRRPYRLVPVRINWLLS
jgi:hypothetical protein